MSTATQFHDGLTPGKEAHLKQLLQESERRILAELREVKDALKAELLEELKSGPNIMHHGSGIWREQHLQEVMSRQTSPSQTQDEGHSHGSGMSGGQHFKEVLNVQDATDESRRPVRDLSSSSSKSNWVPVPPSNVMSRYVPLMGEERGTAAKLSQNVGLLRRFVGGYKRNAGIWEGAEHSCVATVVKSPSFDKVASLLVVLNAIFTGFQVQMHCVYALDLPEELSKVLVKGEMIFLFFFCLEWVLRVIVAGWSFFSCQGDSCRWNWLDTVSVGMQVMDQGCVFLIKYHSELGSSFGLIHIMQVLRLLRIFRVLRLLHLSDELGMLAHAIARSCATVCWAMALMVTMLFACSVTFAERVWHVREANVHGRLAYYFENVPRTMLTLTESVLGGVSWGEPAWLLFSEVGWFSGLVFVIFVILGLFILCNVVTGVFNEGVSKSADEEESRQLAVKLQLAIGMEEPTSSDAYESLIEKITWGEFKDKVLNDDHMRAYFHSINIDPTESSARKIFEFLDINEDRELCRGELFYGCMKLREPARAVDVSLLMHNMAEIEKGLAYVISNTNRMNLKMKASEDLLRRRGSSQKDDPDM